MKKLFLGVGSLLIVFTLASCQSNDIEFVEETTSYPANQNVSGTASDIQESITHTTPVYQKASFSLELSEETSKTTSVEETVEKVYDSVVSINASSMSASSAGSGVLFGEDETLGLSYLVTCFHVIEDASKFEVVLSDGSSYSASLVGGYEDLDLAVLSIEETDLTYAKLFKDSDSLKLGSTVVAIGNPLGTLPGSVSSGVVSYVNRIVQTDTYTTRKLIQTDVAINSGNSGGALFNTAGSLIGIVNAKYSSSGIEGLGFAIPSNDVSATITELLEHAEYDTANKVWSYGYIEGDYEFGFTFSLGYYSSGYGWNVSRNYVYYVSEVETNETYSGASLLKAQDIITALTVDYLDASKTDETITVSTNMDLMEYLYTLELSIGDTLEMSITRNNTQITVSVPIIQFIYSI